MKLSAMAISVAGLGVFVGASAHHSSATFNEEVRMSIEGTIVDVDWVNPHVYLWIEAQNDAGEPVTWEVEGQSPAFFRRLGWAREDFAPGTRYSVTGNPHRDPERVALLMNFIEPAGRGTPEEEQTSFLAALVAVPENVEPATSLAGTWVTTINPETIGTVISSDTISLTDSGRAAVDSYVEAEENPGLECVPYPAPTMMIVPDIKSVDVRDDVVVIRGEFDGSERVVHLDRNDHEGATPSVQGDSIGRFESGALVIDTTDFAPHRVALADGIPSSPAKHLTERLELSDDRTQLIYSFELTDPEYLAEPIELGGMQWWHRPDLEFVDFPCDLESARRFAE
jgi:Family of unknown function (DUF6152)